MKPGKAIAFGVLLSLAVIAFTGIASASTIYVPDDYSTIQAAVNAAYSGDTIIVRDGTYTENIKVDKKRLTIRSENGPDYTIVVAEDPDVYVFEVNADYVKISGFTMEGVTAYENAGIYLYYADYCNITNNNCSVSGIDLLCSNNNSISNTNGRIAGGFSNNNSISNTKGGIALDFSNNNSISNTNGDIVLRFSSNNNSVSNNNCSNNRWHAIELFNSNNNVITNNNCSNNRDDGIYLELSNNNSISNNNCSLNNDDGIFLGSSNNNSISNNNCTNNNEGISFMDSNNNHIYLNNFINNTYNVNSSESTNTWNSLEKITYSYGRRTYTSCLGNYYDDYTGTDRNRDGIGDTPYQIAEDSDMYPLMKRWENYHAPSERQSKIIYFILRWILED